MVGRETSQPWFLKINKNIMPTRELRRIWCKTCNEFELHHYRFPNTEDWFCGACDTKYSPILLKDIPSDKLLEQRKRYKEYKKESIFNYLQGALIPSNPFMELFKDETVHITESDAGQRAIDEREQQKRAAAYEKRRIEREKQMEEAKKYSHLGRNDICICGSGKKYKKCCLDRIRTIK